MAVEIVDYQNFTGGRRRRERPHFIVLHHTGGTNWRSAVNTLKKRNLAYHFLQQGADVRLVHPLDQVAYHAGVANEGSIGYAISHPGFRRPGIDPNWRTGGNIEVVNGSRTNYFPLTEEEMVACAETVEKIASDFGIPLIIPTDRRCLWETKHELRKVSGVVMHYHVSRKKKDGPPQLADFLAKRWGNV